MEQRKTCVFLSSFLFCVIASAAVAGIQADVDQDGDIDHADCAVLYVCFGGSGQSASPACPVDPGAFDLDEDGDVDLDDFALFAHCVGGPDVPIPAGCSLPLNLAVEIQGPTELEDGRSGQLTAVVTGATGPVEYMWEVTFGNAAFDDPTRVDPVVWMTGAQDVTVRMTVTDPGVTTAMTEHIIAALPEDQYSFRVYAGDDHPVDWWEMELEGAYYDPGYCEEFRHYWEWMLVSAPAGADGWFNKPHRLGTPANPVRFTLLEHLPGDYVFALFGYSPCGLLPDPDPDEDYDTIVIHVDVPGFCQTDADCDDGDLCTEDYCFEEWCQSWYYECYDDNPCTYGWCDGETGECVFDPVVCEDGNEWCNPDTGWCEPIPGIAETNPHVDFDNLIVGETVSLTAPPVSPLPDQPAPGCTCAWSVEPASAGTFTDADECETEFTVEVAGDLTISVVVTCDGEDTTFNQDGTAVELECEFAEHCDDADLCTNDACVDGVCVYTSPVECNDDVACTTDTCDPATGECANTDNCPEGESCNHVSGACEGAPACDDETPCVDDGLFCNGIDECVEGFCAAGADPCADTICYGGQTVACGEGDDLAVCGCEGVLVAIDFTAATDSLLGTPGNDVFRADTIFDGGTFPTFTNGDSAQGLAGGDILNATLFSFGSTVAVTLAGIETLNFTDAGTGVSTVDAGSFTDVTTVNSVSSVNRFTMTGVGFLPDFGIENSTKGAMITFTAAATNTSTDNCTLTLTNSTAGPFTIATTAGTNAGLETLNIVSSGTMANKVNDPGVYEMTGTSLETVNVFGSNALTVEKLDNTITTFDGSTATGDITLGAGSNVVMAPVYDSFQGFGDLKFVKTGSGDDTLIFHGGLNASDFDSTTVNEGIDTGTGDDIVQMFPSASLSSSGFALTGVEILKIAANAAALTVNLAEADVLADVVNDTNPSSELITLSNTATIPDLSFVGDARTGASQMFDGFAFSFGSSATIGSGDTMAIVFGNQGAALSDGFTYTAGALTIPGVENFMLTINDSPDSTTIAGMTVAAVKTMTVTGDGNGLFGTIGGAATDAMTSFDASAMTGRLGSSAASVILDSCVASAIVKGPSSSRAWISLAGSTGGVSVTTGNDDDTIIGSPGNDTIASGAGDDNLTGAAGADTLTGGSGSDDFVYPPSSTQIFGVAAVPGNNTVTTNKDVIADFTPGTDDIVVGGAGNLFGVAIAIYTETAAAINTLTDNEVLVVNAGWIAAGTGFANTLAEFDALWSAGGATALNSMGSTATVGDHAIVITAQDPIHSTGIANIWWVEEVGGTDGITDAEDIIQIIGTIAVGTAGVPATLTTSLAMGDFQ